MDTEDFQGVPQHVARTRALEHIDEMLQMHGKTTSSLGLPTTHHRLNGLQSLGQVCICVSTTGIAACELPNRRTAHSMFRFPLKERLVEGCVCDVFFRNNRAELLRKCFLVMWDGIPSTHRFCAEALGRTLRDLTCVNRPFGGNTILLCGDLRHTGPIVPFGADADVVQASLFSSPLWGKFQRRHLTLPQL